MMHGKFFTLLFLSLVFGSTPLFSQIDDVKMELNIRSQEEIKNLQVFDSGKRLLANSTIWDIKSGRKVKELPLKDPLLVPGKNIAIMRSKNFISFFDIKSDQLIDTLKIPYHVMDLSVSENGKYFVISGDIKSKDNYFVYYGKVAVYDVETRKEVFGYQLTKKKSGVINAHISEENKLIAGFTTDDKIEIRNFEGKILKKINGAKKSFLSEDGNFLIISHKKIEVWDLQKLKKIHSQKVEASRFYEKKLSYDPQSKRLILPSKQLHIFNIQNKTYKAWPKELPDNVLVTAVYQTPGSNQGFIGYNTGKIKWIDFETGRVLREFGFSNTSTIHQVVVSDNDKWLEINKHTGGDRSTDGFLRIFDLQSLKTKHTWKYETLEKKADIRYIGILPKLKLSNTGNFIVPDIGSDNFFIYNIEKGYMASYEKTRADALFTHDDKIMLLLTRDIQDNRAGVTVTIYDQTATGSFSRRRGYFVKYPLNEFGDVEIKTERSFVLRNPDFLNDYFKEFNFRFSEKYYKYKGSTNLDMSGKSYSTDKYGTYISITEKSKEWARIYDMDEDGMFIYDARNGYYFGSKKAAAKISFIKNNQVYEFDQFDLHNNRPDLVLQNIGKAPETEIRTYRKAWEKRVRKMGFDPANFETERSFNVPEITLPESSELFVEVTQPNYSISFSAEDKLYYLDRLFVDVNGVPVYGLKGKSLLGKLSKSAKFEENITLSAGKNIIKVSVLNEKGVESLAERFEVTYKPSAEVKPNLQVIAIGVSKFQESDYNLTYADKDANDLSNLLKNSQNLFDNISIHTLTNENATRANVLKLRSELEKTSVDDEVIVFVASHGVLDEELDYYLAMHDMDFANPK